MFVPKDLQVHNPLKRETVVTTTSGMNQNNQTHQRTQFQELPNQNNQKITKKFLSRRYRFRIKENTRIVYNRLTNVRTLLVQGSNGQQGMRRSQQQRTKKLVQHSQQPLQMQPQFSQRQVLQPQQRQVLQPQQKQVLQPQQRRPQQPQRQMIQPQQRQVQQTQRQIVQPQQRQVQQPQRQMIQPQQRQVQQPQRQMIQPQQRQIQQPLQKRQVSPTNVSTPSQSVASTRHHYTGGFHLGNIVL